jgi:hypothetical protein
MARTTGWMAGLATLLLASASYAQKPEESPLLRPIDKAHCLAFYDAVELRLKGKGDEVASITTRNGLKDFFVTRPGVVDCSGQREIPWRDDKDRAFIADVLNEAGAALKPGVDLAKVYGIAPAPKPTMPRL